MRKKLHFLLWCLVFPLFIIAQDSIKSTDSLQLYSFEVLKEKFLDIKNRKPKVASLYLNAMYGKASTEVQRIKTFILESQHEAIWGNESKAFVAADEAIRLSKLHNKPILLGKSWERKGYVYYIKLKDYDTALNYYLKALKIAKSMKIWICS